MSSPHPPPVAPGSGRKSPMPVPAILSDLAGWTWRILLLAAGAYALVQFLDLMHLVVLPVIVAILVTALVYPVVGFFKVHGAPRAVATWITVLISLALVAGIFYLVINRASNQYPQLVSSLQTTTTSVEKFLHNDLHIKSGAVNNVGNQITKYLTKHDTAVLSSSVSIAKNAAEVLTATLLWFFVTFFLLYDGENIWNFFVNLFPPIGRERMQGAGIRMWARLAGFVRGTFLIALFHGIVAAVALSILGVPLVLPLALLVFVGSFLPIVGALIFGALAVLIALATKGVTAGVILGIIFIIDNQIEAHILQPFLVGRYVRLHPLAVALSITGGAVLEGLPGAILAVPIVAVSYAAIRYLALGEEGDPLDAHGRKSKSKEVADDEDATAEDRLVPEINN